MGEKKLTLPAVTGFTDIEKTYAESEQFFKERGFVKRTLGAFVLMTEGQRVAGRFVKIERRGPYASWLLTITSDDSRQRLGLWVNDIVADSLQGIPSGTVIGLVFKGWIEGRQFNYRDYDIYLEELPKTEAKKLAKDEETHQ